MRNQNVLKQLVITKVAGERSKKAQSKELLKSVAVSVSPKLKKIACYYKTNNRKIRERIGRTENPKKQRVSLTKSSAPKLKQHNNQNVKNYEIYVSTCLVFKPLGAKRSSRYCQKLSRILFPPVSLSIILTLISFRNPWWPSSVIIIRLIVTRLMLCICWNVPFVVYNMLVALARLLGLGLTITRRAVVGLIRGPQYPRWNSSGILLKKATTSF